MASTLSKILAIFLVLNLLFVSLASACGSCGGANPYPNPNPKPSPSSGPYPGSGGGSPSTGGGGGGGSPSTGGGGGGGGGGSPSTGGGGGGGGNLGKCPKDTLKLGVCANVLTDLINLKIGSPPKEPCCPLIQGLVDAEVAVCLCTAIKANILGIRLNIPIDLSLLVNYCGRTLPTGFQCP